MNFKLYENLEELKQSKPELVNELLGEYGEGEWQQEGLMVHDSLTDFAEYEVKEGYYASAINTFSVDFNGAPNLFEYIDYEELGQDLPNHWDETTNFDSRNGQVVTTDYGFN